MIKQWGDSSGCPHHGRLAGRCELIRGQVYIPVPEYVRKFCRSDNYVQCTIFLANDAVLDPLSLQEETRVGRRRHQRIPDRISMFLAQVNEENTPEALLDDRAYTLDLSEGGLRFASHRAVDVDSLIFFRFGTEFREPLEGLGRVRWCTSSEDNSLFHAGMMFMDKGIGKVVGRHLAPSA